MSMGKVLDGTWVTSPNRAGLGWDKFFDCLFEKKNEDKIKKNM